MNGPQMPALGVIINGSGIAGPPTVDLEDFEPQPRDRCNTWPLQKPTGDLSHHTSPLIHEQIPEEDNIEDLDGSGDNLDDSLQSAAGVTGFYRSNGATVDESSVDFRGSTSGGGSNSSKKNSARRNAWGNLSYADLITQAILHSPEKRLTLSQIYDWMVQNVPYFRDKGDSNSSAGWKNSIRHNLSLHSRFMRIQNEGAGKSSWWVINPEAKPGKSSRRRTGSMEQSKDLEKKRGRIKKKLDQMRGSTGVLADRRSGSAADLLSPSLGGGGGQADLVGEMYDSASNLTTSGFNLSPGEFRMRSDSNLSNCSVGSSRLSLKNIVKEEYNDQQQPPTGPAENGGGLVDYPELVDSLTRSMNISGMTSQQLPQPPPVLDLDDHHILQGSALGNMLATRDIVQPPPPYSTAVGMNYIPTNQHSPRQVGGGNMRYQQRQVPATNISPHHHHQQQLTHYNISCGGYYQNNTGGNNLMLAHHHHANNGGGVGGLPSELSDIHLDNHFTSDIQCDIDQVIRHEYNVAGKLDFSDFGNL